MGVLTLALTLSLPVAATQAAPLPAESTTIKATADLQPVEASVKGAVTPVKPDVAYTTDQGGRVEVYTSAGDSDGSLDWRSVNAFAYLINGVPKGKHLYATVFNSLYDYGKAKELANGDFQLVDSAGQPMALENTFRPSTAFLNQINQYANKAEAQQYVHVLGAKRSMTEAYNAPSTLARLLHKTGGAGVMKYCSATSTGACLKTSDDDALMHSKYALFEATKDSEGVLRDNVIWVTSANLNGSSGGRKSNTSIAIYEDAAGYQQLRDIVWKASHDEEKLTTAYQAIMNTGIVGTNSDFSFFPSPRTADAEAASLDAAAKVSGKSDCKAYLSHSLFNNKRVALLNHLKRLQDQSCNVKIILGENAISDVVDAYFGMSTDAREIISRVEFGNVHDKAITVSYKVGGTTHGVTWGGSANANGTSLTHDELAFRASDITVTKAVEQQLERMYQLARGGKATEPVTGLTIDPAAVTMDIGITRTLKPRITPTSASVKTVTWESSNNSVATVNATTGEVKGIGAGTATITATSLSGNKTAQATITVNQDAGVITPEAPASPSIINTPPTLSMDNYQTLVGTDSEYKRTDVVVTWGSGAVDITGEVALQYYDSGSWKTKTNIAVTNGRGTTSLVFRSSRAWRLAAKTPAGYSLGSDAKYSSGYAYNVVKTRTNTSTPRIYAPTMAKSGTQIPFLVTWNNPSSRYPTKLRLQYLTGSGWKTKIEVVIDGGGTQKFVSAVAGSSRKWRVATSSASRPRGYSALVSSSVSVKVVG
ncbi:MAG: Ig domain-containing protein [Propionibacteriaceae bacterium]|nr:Ig domain-containing protein [Propionibacteriaceae bacterium]